MFPRACHEAHSYTQWMLNKRPLLISQLNVILNPCGCYKSVEEIWPYNKQYGEIQVTCAAPSFFALFQSKSATQLNTNSTAPPRRRRHCSLQQALRAGAPTMLCRSPLPLPTVFQQPGCSHLMAEGAIASQSRKENNQTNFQ